MKRGPWRRLALLLVAALLAACASLKPSPPELSVVSVRVLEAGFSEQSFGVLLKVRNPNQRDFVISGFNYQLDLGGRPFARGQFSRQVTLPANGETEIEVPANMRLGDFLNSSAGRLLAGAVGGELDYRLTGSARIDEMWTAPFDRSGRISLFRYGRGAGAP